MNICAIDPSSKKPVIASNFELYREQNVETDSLQAYKFKLDADGLYYLIELAQSYGPGILIIEDQMFHNSAHTLKIIAQAAGMLIAPFLAYDWEIIKVQPITWQCALFPGKRMKREQSKLKAKEYASHLVAAEVKDEDVADAICIFDWYRKHRQA